MEALINTGAGLAFSQMLGLSFFLSLAFSGFMVAAGAGDIPDARSSHASVTPTAGGLGLIAGLGGAIAMAAMFFPAWVADPSFAPLLFILLGVAFTGLVDDIFVSPAGPKFFALAAFSCVATYIIGPITALPFGATNIPLPYLVGFAGTALWIFVVMNAANFIDGVNGLMATLMGVASLGLCLVSIAIGAYSAAVWSGLLFAGLCGFLPYNLRRTAKIFCGDIGALVVGFVYAIAALQMTHTGPGVSLLYVGPILILPVLADVFLTLSLRSKNGFSLLVPHREHLFQRLVDTGRSHLRVTLYYDLVAIILMGVVLIGCYTRAISYLSVFVGLILLSVLIYAQVRGRVGAAERKTLS